MLYFSQSFDCLVKSKTKIKVNTNYFIYELVHRPDLDLDLVTSAVSNFVTSNEITSNRYFFE